MKSKNKFNKNIKKSRKKKIKIHNNHIFKNYIGGGIYRNMIEHYRQNKIGLSHYN